MAPALAGSDVRRADTIARETYPLDWGQSLNALLAVCCAIGHTLPNRKETIVGVHEMQCPCGGETRHVEHDVKTLAKLQEWHPTAAAADIPAIVERDICPGCGRQRVLPLPDRWRTIPLPM